jgi:hypothetical protein
MRYAIRATLLLLAGQVGLAMAAESSASGTSIENAFRGAIQDRSSMTADEALFVEKCSMCHRQMGMGTVSLARRVPSERAMLEKRTDLTVDFVKVVARRGLDQHAPHQSHRSRRRPARSHRAVPCKRHLAMTRSSGQLMPACMDATGNDVSRTAGVHHHRAHGGG